MVESMLLIKTVKLLDCFKCWLKVPGTALKMTGIQSSADSHVSEMTGQSHEPHSHS